MTLHAGKFEEILLLEDNARGLERRLHSGVGREDTSPPVKMRLHRINGTVTTTVAHKTYRSDPSRRNPQRRVKALARLLEHTRTANPRSVVVGGTAYGESPACLAMLCDLELPFVVEVRPGRTVTPTQRNGARVPAQDMLSAPPGRKSKRQCPTAR